MFAKIGSKMLYKTKLSRKIFTKKNKKLYTILLIHHFGFPIYFFFQLHGNSRGKLTSDWRHYTGNRIVCNPQCGFPQLSENIFMWFGRADDKDFCCTVALLPFCWDTQQATWTSQEYSNSRCSHRVTNVYWQA